MDELGQAILVNGEVVAWFKYPDELSRDWCTCAHFGEWLAWRATAPKIVPLTESEEKEVDARAKELYEKLQPCFEAGEKYMEDLNRGN